MERSLGRDSTHLPLFQRFAEAAVLACLVTVAYYGMGAHTPPHHAPLASEVDAAIPFVPASVWVYLPGYFGGFLLTLWAVRDARNFRAALTAFGVVTLLALPFFVHFPIPAPRPPAPTDASLTSALVRWLYATDPLCNTFPSLHVANASLCAAVCTAASRRWAVVSWILAIGVWISVLTLKQHWAVDVAAGWALAMVGVAAFRAHLAAASWFAPASQAPVPVPVRESRPGE